MSYRIFISSVQREFAEERKRIMHPVGTQSGPSRGTQSKGTVKGRGLDLAIRPELIGHSQQTIVGTQSGPSRGTQSRDPVGTQLQMSIQERILLMCKTPCATKSLMELVDRKNRTKFKRTVIHALMDDGLIEWTIPDKPTSRLQKYRLTDKGRKLVEGMSSHSSFTAGSFRGLSKT